MKIRCPFCATQSVFGDQFAGRMAACPICRKRFRLPALEAAPVTDGNSSRQALILVAAIVAVGVIVAVAFGGEDGEQMAVGFGLFGAYFAPAIIAGAREHPNGAAILIVNLFLGWTLLGWVIALAWSFTAFDR